MKIYTLSEERIWHYQKRKQIFEWFIRPIFRGKNGDEILKALVAPKRNTKNKNRLRLLSLFCRQPDICVGTATKTPPSTRALLISWLSVCYLFWCLGRVFFSSKVLALDFAIFKILIAFFVNWVGRVAVWFVDFWLATSHMANAWMLNTFLCFCFVLFCFLVLIVVAFKFHFGGHLSKLIVVATIQEVFITMLGGIDQPLEEAARSNLNFTLSKESCLALNALRQVRFSYYIFHQKRRICSGLFCSCNVTQNTLTNIYLCPKVVQ